MNKIDETISALLCDEKKRKRVQFRTVYITLAVISAVMTVINFASGTGALSIATLTFCLLCLADLALSVIMDAKLEKLSAVLFIIQLLALLIFFTVSGSPEGFSAVWIAMLPSCGMLLFGRKVTAILSGTMLIIMIFFFWTDQGQSVLMYNYTQAFRQRFPVLFVSSFVMSWLLETIYVHTYRELQQARANMHELYSHDYLTGSLNRYGLDEWYKRTSPGSRQAVMMFDLDFFKQVNDTYGHDAGDAALKAVAAQVDKLTETALCRWGGEEFVVWYPDKDISDELAEEIRRAVEVLSIKDPDSGAIVHMTISIGIARGSAEDNLYTLINDADKYMYQAKQSGRNCIISE